MGIALKSKGLKNRSIAIALDLAFTTVRGWIRRFSAKVNEIIQLFNLFALSLDASLNAIYPSESKFKDAVEAIGRVMNASRLRLGDSREWSIVSRISEGKLLFHKNSPFKIPP